MPKIAGFDHFTIICRDLDESIRWYQEVMGATIERPKRRAPDPGLPAGLAPVGIRVGPIGIDLFQSDGDWQPYPGTYCQHYAFNIPWEDVDEWFEHMRAHGIELEIHPAGPEVISLYFVDPTGYHMELNLRSMDKEYVIQQRERLLAKWGNLYYFAQGFGVPEQQPRGQWA
ncbi:MAG: Fumarylacetoacetase [Chloroflexi bacterium]|nr:Fumarylacetoacetase [Chloroflexota bacterium]